MVSQTLRRSRMFSDLPSDQLDALVQGTELVKLSKNEFLFHEGQKAEGFYVVHRGAINVHRVTPEGREQVIRVFYPGECFGEVVLVGPGTYPASAMAAEASQVILIPRTFFRERIFKDPELALRILVSMSLHLKYLIETIEDLKLKHAESRVTQWILRRVQQSGADSGESGTITIPTSKRLLASQLGITSETFSRVLARLRESGCIAVQGKRIELLSAGELQKVLGEESDTDG